MQQGISRCLFLPSLGHREGQQIHPAVVASKSQCSFCLCSIASGDIPVLLTAPCGAKLEEGFPAPCSQSSILRKLCYRSNLQYFWTLCFFMEVLSFPSLVLTLFFSHKPVFSLQSHGDIGRRLSSLPGAASSSWQICSFSSCICMLTHGESIDS